MLRPLRITAMKSASSPSLSLPVLQLLLVESDDEAARILQLGIRKTAPWVQLLHDSEIPAAGRDYASIDAVLLNHNLHDDTFSKCYLLKQLNPQLKIIVLSAPGEPLQHFQKLRELTGLIHDIFDKPLYLPRLARTLEELARANATRSSALSLSNLQRHLPASLSMDELEGANTGDAIRTEKTILFVDIRRSTEILRQHSLDDFFAKLNRYLAMLSKIVERNRGEVIKYTGDGMLALFGGFGRRYLGFRCARELLAEPQSDAGFSIGLGLTDGLVMLGFIGTENRLFYDVIGSNVNIAARFCAEARAGEMLLSDDVQRAAGLPQDAFTQHQLTVKGLDQPINCHRYQPGSSAT